MKRSVVLVLLAGLGFATSAGQAVAGTDFDRVRAAELDLDRVVKIENFEIDLGYGAMMIDEGTVIPAKPVGDRTLELVFVGNARFLIEPPNAVERSQLALFTEQQSLDAVVSDVVLAFGAPEVMDGILQAGIAAPADADVRQRATKLFDGWISGAERKGFGVDAALVRAVHGDHAYRNYFAAIFSSEAHGRFYYFNDPSELEQVTLGQFVPFDLDDRQRYAVDRQIRRAKRRGRSIQTRIDDLGDWNTWLRTTLVDSQGQAQPGSPGFEPKHYELKATIRPSDKTIQARASLELLVEDANRRGLTLDLFADLKPSSIQDGEGRDLSWSRSGSDLHVVLAEATKAGETIELIVEYAGVALDKLEGGVFTLRDTYSWYPHAGLFDRATYDVELRWPKGRQLLASGRVVDSRIEAGMQVERHRLEVPAMAFSFEVGVFDVYREQVGHVQLTVAFSKTSMSYLFKKKDVVETLKDSLTFFEEEFGAYPADYLTVVTVPRFFSQGFLSFVTLSHFLLQPPRDVDPDSQAWREVVAHELSHQWWGNKVGWYNYRDQWLSEALANYSAVRYISERAERPSVYLARNAQRWKGSLGRGTKERRSVESLGPVVMGQRLFSSHSSSAYQAVVYDKGFVVFSMLSNALGKDVFSQMLEALANAVSNRAINTEIFLKSIERMSGVDLEAFAQQFIYGTGIPEIYYNYEIAPAPDGKWRIAGEAHQMMKSSPRPRLIETEFETWDVRPGEQTQEAPGFALLVPFQIILEGSNTDEAWRARRRTGYSTGRGLGGNVLMKERETNFEFVVDEKPEEFWLDQRGQVLARCYSRNRWPKSSLRFEAQGRPADEAESLLRQALDAPMVSEAGIEALDLKQRDLDDDARLTDARIHLDLARIDLNRGRADGALDSLQRAEKLLGREFYNAYRSIRRRLWTRLDLRDGKYEDAYRRLEGKVRLTFPNNSGESLADVLRRTKWKSGRFGTAEDYAALAVAAFEIGNDTVARRAADEAEERGAEMAPLEARFAQQ